MTAKIKVNVIKISGEFIKLDSFLKFAGICGTGGEAKALILDGGVRVGNEVCLERGRKLRDGAIVFVLGGIYKVKAASEG